MPLWAYLLALLLFVAMILVHELGHYWASRRCRIAVAEFALGFGPRLFGVVRGDMEWTVRLIPLGGYVRWHEEGPGAFPDAPMGARFWSYLAGPLANFVLTFGLLVCLFGLVLDQGLVEAFRLATAEFGRMLSMWFTGLAQLFGGGGLAGLMGPVGIAHDTAQAAVQGTPYFLFVGAFLSLNIGLVNLLPLPALDGGRMLLIGLERIRRRPLDPAVEGWMHAAGFLALMALALFTVVKDLLV